VKVLFVQNNSLGIRVLQGVLTAFAYLLVIGLAGCDRLNLSRETREVVERIESINEVMGSAVGMARVRPKQYDNYVDLQNTASREELYELTDHPNAVVRCYASLALSESQSVDPLSILLNHIDDNESVITFFECIKTNVMVGDFLITNARYQLDSAQAATLDSTLIYKPNHLFSRATAIGRAVPCETLYWRLRELVLRDGDGAALEALAKYQREQDVELILNNCDMQTFDEGTLDHAYRAISYFPHPAFVPMLEKHLEHTLDNDHYYHEWQYLYEAIASYQNSKAVALLSVPFTRVEDKDIKLHHLEFVLNALSIFTAPIYDSLLWRLWADENVISLNIFEYLSRKNPEKALQLTRKNLYNAEAKFCRNRLTLNDLLGSADDSLVANALLDFVLLKDRPFALEVIRTNITDSSSYEFYACADKASEIKDRSFVEPLFSRLIMDENPYIYLKAAEVLLFFNDNEIDQRLVRTWRDIEDLKTGWGVDEFRKLLKEHGLN